MTDKKDEDNILIGPWPTHDKKNNKEAQDWVKEKYKRALDKKNTQLKMQEKILKVDTITESIMVNLIHSMAEQGYNIQKKDFILDIGFLSETVKSMLFRQEKLPHVVQGLIDNVMAPDRSLNEDGIEMHYSRFDTHLLGDMIDMAESISNDNEVLFEPEIDLDGEKLETDPEKISDWKNKKDTEKDDE
tara:strand:+ start:270 stop:833 length:564 start_codon:yes stop_codon:yes gene_type:complete